MSLCSTKYQYQYLLKQYLLILFKTVLLPLLYLLSVSNPNCILLWFHLFLACCIDLKQEKDILKSKYQVWKTLLPVTKLKAHNQHFIEESGLNNVGVVSHVRLTIAPDGGISRFRIWGSKCSKPCAKLWSNVIYS